MGVLLHLCAEPPGPGSDDVAVGPAAVGCGSWVWTRAFIPSRLERGRQARMGMIHVFAERVVDAPAAMVYGYLADMREHHPRFLPSAFCDFEVETGGVGEGTITRFTVTVGGRSREYRMRVTEPEPEPGRVLTSLTPRRAWSPC